MELERDFLDLRSVKDWSEWLDANHQREQGIWLLFHKKSTALSSLTYDLAVDEALCHGWIDSQIKKRDASTWLHYFSPRNLKSNWSAVNKSKVERLIAEGRMRETGLAKINWAKENGTWDALNEVEALIIPDDLAEQFQNNQLAETHFNGFSRSSKRAILEWILNAKKAETRKKRIDETVRLAERNKKANHPKDRT